MRLRLILSFTLVVMVSVTSVVIIARLGAMREVGRFMFRGGMLEVETLVADLEDYYRSRDSWQGVESLFSLMGQGQGHGGQGMGFGMMNQRLRLADEYGNLIVDTAGLASPSNLTSEEQVQAIPLLIDRRTVGYLLPEGGVPFNRSDERLLVNRINNAALLAGLIGGGLSLVLAFLLTYRLLKPVQELTQASRRLASGDLSQRVPIRGGDELADLGKTFNQMAGALQQAEQNRRSLTADIAHELRNPLAVQRAQLEAILDGVYPLASENLVSILEQNHLLSRLVDDLRTLALADSGQLDLHKQLADLAELVQRVIDRFKPQSEANQIALIFEKLTGPLPVLFVDPGRIEQILSNLLSNALRFTPRGGQICLSMSSSANQVELQVRDSGPGIPSEALPRLFDRFYRVDSSRSRQAGGSGLGLSIARQLAEAHGGTLSAANDPTGGAVFTLTLKTNNPRP